MVMWALGYAFRRKWAKELPAIPEPDMRTLGLDMFRVKMSYIDGTPEGHRVLLLIIASWMATSVILYIEFLCSCIMRERESRHLSRSFVATFACFDQASRLPRPRERGV